MLAVLPAPRPALRALPLAVGPATLEAVSVGAGVAPLERGSADARAAMVPADAGDSGS